MHLLYVIFFMATSFLVSTLPPACPLGDFQFTCAPGFFYYVDATNYGACYAQGPPGSASSDCVVAKTCQGNSVSCGGVYTAHCQGDCPPFGSCECQCYLNYPDQNIYTLDHFACYDGIWDGLYPNFPIGAWINNGACTIGKGGTNPNPLQCCFWKNAGKSGTEICFEGSTEDMDIINFNDEISSYQCSGPGVYAVLWYDKNYGGASLITEVGGSASFSSGDYWNDEISSVQICQVVNSDVCGNWYNAYQVTSTVGGIQIPVWSWLKSAPQNIQTWWNQYDCNHKMCGYLRNQNGIIPPYTVDGYSTSLNPWIPLYEMLQCPALLHYSLIYEGCYVDSSNRYFKGPSFQQQYMSVETCFLLCNNLTQSYPYTLSYPFFGVEDGNQCFCGSNSSGTAVADPTESLCSSTCTGNLDQKCGGFWYISVYKAVGLRYEGCFADSPIRYLTGPTETSGSYMSVEACFQFCNPGTVNYPYIGVEDGNQCFCGTTSAGTAVADPSQTFCGIPCLGNPTQMCGGSWYISVYSYINSDVCASWLNNYDFYNALTPAGLTWGQSEAPSSIQTLWSQYDCDHKICFYWKSNMRIPPPYTLTSSAGAIVPPYNHFGCPNLLYNNLLYLGCFVDSSTRVLNYLNGPSYTESPMSVEICFILCNPGRLNFKYIGVENGNQCFCSPTINAGAIDQYGCNQVCSGNLDQSCGGSWRISVWMVVWGVSTSEESEAVEEEYATYSGVQMSVTAIACIVVGVVVVVVVAIIGVVMFRRHARVSKVDDSKLDDTKVDNAYPLME